MKELNVFCVDDEPLALRRLQVLIERLPATRLVGEATSAQTALAQIEALRPDVVLLDIELGGASGLDVAAALADKGSRVIFVTAFPEFALEAFGVAARDYLLKPVSQARLASALQRVRRDLDRHKENETALWFRKRDVNVRLRADQIDLVSADRDYVHVHAGAERYMMRKTLAELQDMLGPDKFVRVHKSHLVRVDLIQRVRNRGGGDVTILLPTGQSVRVGRTFMPAIRALAGS